MNEKDIIRLIETDSWMMEVLQTVKKLQLPDWWIGAGFVRSKVWDSLHGYSTRTPLPDIDVIYLDINDFSKEETRLDTTKAETGYETKLRKIMPNLSWSVTNQARMHVFHQDKPYRNSEESLSHWVETATCIGVMLDEKGVIILMSPWGVEDLVNLIIRPSPSFQNDTKQFYERIEKKQWLTKWPKLKIIV